MPDNQENTPPELCRTIETQLHEYLDSLLPEQEQERLEGHVKGCEPCAALVRFEQDYLATLKTRWVEERVPDPARRKIGQALRSEPASRIRAVRAWQPLRWVAVLALVLLTAALWLLSRDPYQALARELVEDHTVCWKTERDERFTGGNLVELAEWYKQKINLPVEVTPSCALIFHPEESRVCTIRDHPTAHVMTTVEGKRCSLFMTTSKLATPPVPKLLGAGAKSREVVLDGTKFTLVKHGDLWVFLWEQNGVSHALVVPQDLDSPERLASQIAQRL